MRSITLLALLLVGSGCQLMPHALQPHQLWKLNRQPATSRDDAYFSVPDPPVAAAEDRGPSAGSVDPFLGE